MAEKLILTDKEVKLFKRAGWVYGILTLVWLVWMVVGWTGYFHNKAILDKQEAEYELKQEEMRRIQSFMRATQLNSSAAVNQSLNAVTGE